MDIHDYLYDKRFEEKLLKALRKHGECCFDCGKYFLPEHMKKIRNKLFMKPIKVCKICYNKRMLG